MLVLAHISSQRPSGPISIMAGEFGSGESFVICDFVSSSISLLSLVACLLLELLVFERVCLVGCTVFAAL